jgi:hypothetical protein
MRQHPAQCRIVQLQSRDLIAQFEIGGFKRLNLLGQVGARRVAQLPENDWFGYRDVAR